MIKTVQNKREKMKKLLIVDMQKGFINKNNDFLVKNIQNLIGSSRFDKIYATKFINHTGSQFFKFLNWRRFCENSEIDFAVDLPKEAVVIEKTSYAFAGGEVEKNFDKTDEIYLCGTDYDSCVLAIAFQLFDFGICPHILIDCVGSHSDNPVSKTDFEKICEENFSEQSILRTKNLR